MFEMTEEENLQVYKDMYYRLFNYVTDAIRCTVDDETRKILINAQKETEEMYLSYI